ncbi:MAG: PDZ domain-containing protein [Planctomycetaceae bacterium]|nr:PDZ domain-containing protein [Planctomycetaceae bacterium]
MSRWMLTLLAFLSLAGSLQAQSAEEKVRNDKKLVEQEGYWLYGDLAKGFEVAKQNNQPIVVILRCLPCKECVKLDDELIDGDARIKPLLEQFVRVRIVSTNGLDLSLFQFDTDQSFAVFFLHGDGTILGRFGTRSDRTEWIGDVSIDGLAKAMQKALDLHRDFPQVKASLTAKRGPVPEFTSPEKFPVLSNRYKSTLDYDGKVAASCIHCHQIGDAIRDTAFLRKQKLPDEVLFPYPHPKSIGLILNPKERATVENITAGSFAAQSGFRARDVIEKLNDQPLVSIADVQWVLNSVPATGGEVRADVIRDGQAQQLVLKLPAGWRELDDISWRASTWGLRRQVLGGMYLRPLTDDARAKLKLPKTSLSLQVKYLGKSDLAHRAGVRLDDVLVGIDSRTDLLRDGDLIAYIMHHKQPKEALKLNLLRNGEPLSVTITMPD